MIDKSLIPFLIAGDPCKKFTLNLMERMDEYADMIELGIPFTDPIADGPTIQGSTARALEQGIDIQDVFQIVKTFKNKSNTPIILMSYYNLIYVRGTEHFLRSAKDAGVDGIIMVDLPLEESDRYVDLCDKFEVKPIFLAAPNTSYKRLKKIDELSSFIYLVSTFGTTGSRKKISKFTYDAIKRTKKICNKPIGVGFGISKPAHVENILKVGADGVIMGSSLIENIEKDRSSAKKKIEEKLKEFKEVMKC